MKITFEPFCTPLYSCNGTASVFYSSHITPLHSHNAVQLVFALTGKFLFRTEHIDWKNYKSIIIKENVVHQLNTNESLQLIIYIDQKSKQADAISEKYLKEVDVYYPEIVFSPLEEMLFHQNLIKPHAKSLQLLTELILKKILDFTVEIPAHKRIAQVLKLIKQADPADLSISHLADKVFISPSRLRMQFKNQVGISLHKYLVRYRLILAITDIVNGCSIRDAAYKVGFNDSSHFNKLMVKTFEINPSNFLKENKLFYVVEDDNPFKLETSSN